MRQRRRARRPRGLPDAVDADREDARAGVPGRHRGRDRSRTRPACRRATRPRPRRNGRPRGSAAPVPRRAPAPSRGARAGPGCRCHRGASPRGAAPARAAPAVPGQRADGEARLRRRAGQQQPPPVGREREGVDAVSSEVSFSATPPESATRCTWRARRKSTWPPSGREDRRAVVDRPVRQRAGRPPAVSTHQHARAVVVALHGPARIGNERAVARDGRITERDLAPDEARGSQRHRSEDTAPMSLLVALVLAVFVLPLPGGSRSCSRRSHSRSSRSAGGSARAGALVDRRRGAVGQRAEAATDLDPTGQVLLHGERWQARSSRAVEAGTTVEIDAVNGLELAVRPIWPGPQGG